MRRRVFRTDRLYLTAAALVPMALDFTLTLLGQHRSYWAGKGLVEESNPVWAALLLIHPAMFLVGVTLYALLFAAGILFTPKPIAWWLSVVLLLTHSAGAQSWLWHFTEYVTPWEVMMNGSIAALATFCFLKASRRVNDNTAARRGPTT